jgi:nitrous oxide reductase accessory protein NosL
MKKLLTVLIMLCFLCAVSGQVLADEHGARPECSICGMYIDQFHDTSTRLTLKDGTIMEGCGVACMFRLINDKGGPDAFSKLEVHDWQSKTFTAAADALYVIGSRKIPDMMPNLIAFAKREEAEAFRTREGGEILNFTQGLMSISPMGMTMPAKIKTAVISPKGALGVGAGYMFMAMDKVKLGSESIDPLEFARRPGQLSAPKYMTVESEMLMLSYSITDYLSLNVNAANFSKRMESYKLGGTVTDTNTSNGFGDLDTSVRYNLWNDVYYSKFLSLLAGATLPTGQFKSEFITMPGLQIGTGAFSFTGGLLFSHRIKDFWFHYQGSYTMALENNDKYKFGNATRVGAALHYTPAYDLMIGVEVDGAYCEKDRYQSNDLGNTGGFKSYITGVAQWKFLTALGGNFSIRAAGGIPIYEDLNHDRVGLMERTKIGGGYNASVMLNFSKRFPFY